MIRRLVAPALVVLAFVSPVAAGEPTERLRALFAEANHILLTADSDTALEERVAAIQALVNDAFDAREGAALALGREWHARTPVERDEFVRLYADLVERAYLAWIGSRARVHGNGVRVAFESEWMQGERATVLTTLQTRGGGEMPIEYRMSRRDGRWAVHDVAVDGLSLAESYRAQFHRVLQGGTYADLVDRLHYKASPSTLIAIAKARTARRAAMAVPPARPFVGAAAASARVPPPVRVASTAPVSDAPPVESRFAAPISTAAVAISAPVTPPPRPAVAEVAPPISAARPTAVETPAPVAPAAIVPAARKWFWIQVGAFRDPNAASRLVERLRKHSVTVATGGQRSGPLARVLVGPFANRSAAASTLRELAAGGYRAFIAFE